MDYNEVMLKIHSFKGLGSRLGLERINRLLELLGNPHQNMKVIHVAGTNGKGSVCRFVYSILQKQGYKTGLYTSPYLERFTERIEFNGKEISENALIEASIDVFEKAEKMISQGFDSPTEFEIITAIAFNYYSKQDMDYLVLEVGLGGRGDATNVIKKPLVSVITTIGFDHTEYLGDTLAKIAYEKAGIIKKNCPVVTSVKESEALEVIKKTCKEKNSQLTKVPFEGISNTLYALDKFSFDFQMKKSKYSNIEMGMLGMHQIENASTALTTIKIMKKNYSVNIGDTAIYEGLKNSKQKGRFEIISQTPLVIIDGAHNLQGMNAFKNTVRQLFSDKKILLCMGMLKDKNVEEAVDAIASLADEYIITEPDSDRKMASNELIKMIENNKKCHEVPDIFKACEYAYKRSSEFDVIFFTGSLYLIGKVRQFFRSL